MSEKKENTRPSGAEGTEDGAGSRPLTRIGLCACVSDDGERCIALRYPEAPELTDDGAPERCECSCHDFQRYDE